LCDKRPVVPRHWRGVAQLFSLGSMTRFMNSSPHIHKARRNLKALFILAFLLTLMMSASGGYVLAAGHSHPDVTFTMPVWEYGQFLLLAGLVNLFVYACIFIQVRRLVRGVSYDHAT
jgi:hypothetical protein